ncbi:MAG: conjugal transfer protein TraF [Mariprofundaceae bacterium]
MIMRILLIVGLFVAIVPAIAHARSEAPHGAFKPFFEDKERGWFWYERMPETKKDKKKETKRPEFPFPPKTIAQARKQLKELAERAVMHPTEANLVAYIRLQNWVNEKSERFANAWKQALWMHPELDYSVEHPTDARALVIRRASLDVRTNREMASIARRHGLIFVFRSDCPYCHAESPMLKRFAMRYGFSVIPVSQDGRGLPEWPSPERDTGISRQFGVRSVPALFLVNPKRREVFPVAFGLVSESELSQRIIAIVRTREGRRSLQ